MSARILVAGGAGYIGSYMVKMLAKRGYLPVTLDNLSRGHRELVVAGEFLQGDLMDKRFLQKVFTDYQFEAVFHFAALAYVGESMTDPSLYYRNNVCATYNLLQQMIESKVKYFIFSSTCATYGEPQWLPLTEDHPQNPISPYGRTKLIIEWMLKDFCKGYDLSYVNLRYFNAAGADPEGMIGEWHDPETHLIPNILLSLLGKKAHLEIYGNDYPTPDGTCVRDYIHIYDLCKAHLLALDYLRDNGEPTSFNLGNGKGFSIMEVIEAVEKATGRKIEYCYRERRKGDPAKLVGSSARAENVLGWKPEYQDIESIIRTAWKWHKKQVNKHVLFAGHNT